VAIRETCSVCTNPFDVQFRYQMEERQGGFSFFCSQKCLETSMRAGDGDGVNCDACAKHFSPSLVSQVFFVAGKRVYACGLGCRAQLLREASGARLGDIAREASAPPAPEPTYDDEVAAPASVTPPSSSGPSFTPPSFGPPSSAPSRSPDAAATVVSTLPKTKAPPPPVELAPVGARPRRIAVFNHKGGTGKTTSAVSIAAGLAAKGHKVLLVDTDAQGNVSVSLGAKGERSLYHVLVMGLRVSDVATTIRPNLDLVPSNETLAAAELYLAGRQNRDRVLRDRLAAASEGYDYVVLDCSPSLSLMNQNALVFAESVLVPVACDYLSLVGVRQVIKTVKNVNALLHHPVQIWGVLPTFYDARANICREAVATLKNHFGDRCLPPVRAAIKIKEAPAQGQTIFEYAAGSNSAEDYGVVVDRIIAAREASEAELTGRASAEGRAARPANAQGPVAAAV
jgi:chromosome partitioning protein